MTLTSDEEAHITSEEDAEAVQLSDGDQYYEEEYHDQDGDEGEEYEEYVEYEYEEQ